MPLSHTSNSFFTQKKNTDKMSTDTTYPVYLLSEIGAPRDHHSLFVLTSPSTQTGFKYQVSGNIQIGMFFNHKTSSPSQDIEVLSQELIGQVSKEIYDSGRWRELIESVEAPGKQFDGPKRLVRIGEVRRCQEWTREVIELLRKEGALVE